MAKNTTFADKLQGFSARVKMELSQVTEQKLATTKEKVGPKEEQQLNVWIPKKLMKRLKVKGVESDKSLKEMVTEALEQFL